MKAKEGSYLPLQFEIRHWDLFITSDYGREKQGLYPLGDLQFYICLLTNGKKRY